MKMIVGGVQIGGIQKVEFCVMVVVCMMVLMEQVYWQGVQFFVYLEMMLIMFFLCFYVEDRVEFDYWFEIEMFNVVMQLLFDLVWWLGMGFIFGYCELMFEGQYFNILIIVLLGGDILFIYCKIYLLGYVDYDFVCMYQYLEKCYFLVGDIGFNVVCNQGVIMGMVICNDWCWFEIWCSFGL